MVHWSDYSLRGWLSFLSFMHIGTAFRCFYDNNFLRDKIFTTDAAKGNLRSKNRTEQKCHRYDSIMNN